MSVISDLMLIVIALFGISYMMGGKPRTRYYVNRTHWGRDIIYKQDNFTKKLLKALCFLGVLYLLGVSV